MHPNYRIEHREQRTDAGRTFMELPKIDFRYLKEAFKEPINFWGMAGFAVAGSVVTALAAFDFRRPQPPGEPIAIPAALR